MFIQNPHFEFFSSKMNFWTVWNSVRRFALQTLGAANFAAVKMHVPYFKKMQKCRSRNEEEARTIFNLVP